MGQAKNRGTYEQRVEQAQEADRLEQRSQQREEYRRRTDAERRRAMNARLMLAAILAMSNGGMNP